MLLFKKLTKHSLVRFCLVGALGFLINFILLTVFYKYLRLPLFIAQLLAGEVALFNNFLLHHLWTYKDHSVEKTIFNLLIQFHVTSWLAIVGTAAIVSGCVNYFHMHYITALVIGGITGIGWNFIWTRFVIWRKPQSAHSPVEDIKSEVAGSTS